SGAQIVKTSLNSVDGYAVATTLVSGGQARAVVLRLEADGTFGSNGWQREFRLVNDGSDTTATGIVESGGSLYVTGSTNHCAGGSGVCAYNVWVMQIDADGNPIAQRVFDISSASDIATAITDLEDGSIVVTGTTSINTGLNTPTDVFILHMDADLNMPMSNEFGEIYLDTGQIDAAYAITKLPTGGFAIAGSSGGRAAIMTATFDNVLSSPNTFGDGTGQQIESIVF